ncbi:MAG: hypothetical protein JW764_07500 [Chlorobiaceae bacterium]|nr:hypothetical protein [Chlorobiaceae bacterium]
MKRIVVIGSKPNAVIPDGDTVYCANVSIVYYADQVARFRQIVNVITPKAIADQKPRNSSGEQDCYTKRWEAMLAAWRAQLVILESSNASRMIEGLRNAGYDAPISSISHQERRKLVSRVSGCDDPILSAEFFRLPPKLQARYAGSAISITLKRIFDQGKTCNPIFRPSTGIISLLYALDQHGPDCEYVVAGIGMNNRSVYIHSERTSAQRTSGASIPPHVFADRKVLQAVSNRYRITTTEPELMGILPPFAGGEHSR